MVHRAPRGMLGVVFRGSSSRVGRQAPFGDAGHREASPGTWHDAPDSLQDVGITSQGLSTGVGWPGPSLGTGHCALGTSPGIGQRGPSLGTADIPWGPSAGHRGEGTFLGDTSFGQVSPGTGHRCRGDTGDAPWGRGTAHQVPCGVSGAVSLCQQPPQGCGTPPTPRG